MENASTHPGSGSQPVFKSPKFKGGLINVLIVREQYLGTVVYKSEIMNSGGSIMLILWLIITPRIYWIVLKMRRCSK